MVKQRVVYVLGAGFSQPYGLPVMSTFMDRARDIYERNKDKYHNLGQVIRELERLNSHSLRIDISNIEEVLSVLEVGSLLRDGQEIGGLDAEQMKYFIRTVITENTKRIPNQDEDDNVSDGWPRHIFNDRGGIFSEYGFFVASLFGISVSASVSNDSSGIPRLNGGMQFSQSDQKEVEYTIVTTNYDRVLQNFEEYINARLKDPPRDRIEFVDKYEMAPKPTRAPVVPLLKLHGTVESAPDITPHNDITVMTWNKNLMKPETARALREAYQAIRSAHHIRIIGYSLPETDSYLKYLLKAATLNHPNLKSIDVLTLDDELGSTKSRYQTLLGEKPIRWKSDDVTNYLRRILDMAPTYVRNGNLSFGWLEEAHRYFFEHAEWLRMRDVR